MKILIVYRRLNLMRYGRVSDDYCIDEKVDIVKLNSAHYSNSFIRKAGNVDLPSLRFGEFPNTLLEMTYSAANS
jgi:hypothetical protein